MMQYNVLEVLQHFGLDTRTDGGVLKTLCPFHDDHTPSGNIDLLTGKYNCWACGKRTDMFRFLSRKFDKPLREIYFSVAKLTGTTSRYKVEDPANVEAWHVALFSQPQLLAELQKRAIGADLIATHRIGAFVSGDGAAVIRIPIRDKKGDVIAVKDYRPSSKTEKYTWPNCVVNRSNRNEDKHSLLFPVEQLYYDTILICGGELKAVAAAGVLNQYDIGAISGTGSESVPFTPAQLAAFQAKVVYVCYDVDETGRKYSEILCQHLKPHVSGLYKVELPLSVNDFPHGDVNDFIASGGNLYELLQNTPQWVHKPAPFDNIDSEEEAIPLSLEQAVYASNAKKKVRVNIVVDSMDTSPYPIPKDITVTCDRNHAYCQLCKIYANYSTNSVDVSLNPERLEVIEMVGKELEKQDKVLKKAFGIPNKCSAVSFQSRTFHHVEDLRVSQHLDITSRTNERSMQAAYYVGEKRVELNEGYEVIGRMYPHPATQQATLLLSDISPLQDALSTYTPSNLAPLRVFQPKEWAVEGIAEKLSDIYNDLVHNVTMIYGRDDLHLLYDLAYHSVLLLPRGVKGWVEVLVIGDSGLGKSTCVDRLLAHYGLGERIICKNASLAGLLGGVEQHGKRWFASWGKIPRNDRRLVVLDELKGASESVIAGLTDMRSSGIAELTKIERRRTNARTRIIAISNPRSDKGVTEHNTGVNVVRELIGGLEDVRRFDAIMVLAKDDSNKLLVNATPDKNVPHTYTAALCRELILFGWTAQRVEVEDITHLYKSAVTLTDEYVEDVPIVDSGTIREKLLRLATALAVRTFSVDGLDTVVVRNCHVDFIVQFLQRLYSSEAFGYLEYSIKRRTAEQLINPDEIKHRILSQTPYPKELVRALLLSEEFDSNIFSDILGWPPQEAKQLFAFFNRQRALRATKKAYRKTAGFTKLLKEMEQLFEEESRLVANSRPVFVEEEF